MIGRRFFGTDARPIATRVYVVGLLALALPCCGGTQDALHTSPEPTLENVQRMVFEPACAIEACHDASTQAGELDLSTLERSRDGLIGIPAVNSVAAENRWLLVKPGDPERSFLVRKIEFPGMGEGAPMPVGDQQLTDPYVDLLYEWIEDMDQ